MRALRRPVAVAAVTCAILAPVFADAWIVPLATAAPAAIGAATSPERGGERFARNRNRHGTPEAADATASDSAAVAGSDAVLQDVGGQAVAAVDRIVGMPAAPTATPTPAIDLTATAEAIEATRAAIAAQAAAATAAAEATQAAVATASARAEATRAAEATVQAEATAQAHATARAEATRSAEATAAAEATRSANATATAEAATQAEAMAQAVATARAQALVEGMTTAGATATAQADATATAQAQATAEAAATHAAEATRAAAATAQAAAAARAATATAQANATAAADATRTARDAAATATALAMPRTAQFGVVDSVGPDAVGVRRPDRDGAPVVYRVAPNATITRDATPAALAALLPGDTVELRLDATNQARIVTASAGQSPLVGAVRNWWWTGFAPVVLLGLLVRARTREPFLLMAVPANGSAARRGDAR